MATGWLGRLRFSLFGTETINAEDKAVHHLSQAYLDVLRMPHGGVRARQQKVLSALRDALSEELNDTPEHIQTFYEEWAVDPDTVKRRVLAMTK